MDICIYKNLKISESIKLSKKKTQKLHRKFMLFEFDTPEGFIPSRENNYGSQYRGINTLLSTEYLSTDKKQCFDINREPNKQEIIQFAKMHEKTLKRYLAEKSYKMQITDELEKELCDLFEVFNFDEPKSFEYFK